MALEPGSRLGPYEIVELRGKGGMGEVYRARDTRLGRDVAVKVLPSSLSKDATFKRRFEREAKTISQLQHPNICTLYDVGSENGLDYLVMEYLEGETLEDRLKKGALPIKEALRVAGEIAEAIEAAHRRAVVHRDLKPGNVMLTVTGAKVVDFGLARGSADREVVDTEATTMAAAITEEGHIFGTMPYMAPEQLQGGQVDARADIWALGCIVHELVSGSRPFSGDSQADLIASILRSDPDPPSRHQPLSPPRLDWIVSRCLDKNPDRRWQSARDLAIELEALEERSGGGRGEQHHGKRPSIAVLPFANMSADPEQEYFCDGMAEELINALTQLENLHVVARTSAFSFKGRDVDVREIGKELGVRSVLEGSVRKAGARIRVTAQLVNVSDGYHLWSQRYDRELEDVFAIQDEITLAIVDELRVQLFGTDSENLVKRRTRNREAFTLYLKARYHFHKLTVPDLQTAVEYSKQAIELDAEYAEAYFTLAGATMFMGGAGPMFEIPPTEAYPIARSAIDRSIELNSSLAEVHVMRGIMRVTYRRDWAGAESSFGRALALSPDSGDAHRWSAWRLWWMRRFDEALAQFERAVEADPLDPLSQTGIAMVLYSSGRYDEALAQLERVLTTDRNYYLALQFLGDTYCETGDLEAAHRAFSRALSVAGEEAYYVYARLCAVLEGMGQQEEAKKHLNKLVAISKLRYVPPAYVGILYLGIGDYDTALDFLEKAVDEGTLIAMVWLVFRWSAPVRSDPRFLSAMSRVGLGEMAKT